MNKNIFFGTLTLVAFMGAGCSGSGTATTTPTSTVEMSTSTAEVDDSMFDRNTMMTALNARFQLAEIDTDTINNQMNAAVEKAEQKVKDEWTIGKALLAKRKQEAAAQMKKLRSATGKTWQNSRGAAEKAVKELEEGNMEARTHFKAWINNK